MWDFLAAVLALILWGVQQEVERRRRVRSIRAALAAEVATITALVRLNRYTDELRQHAKALRSRQDAFGYPIYIVHIQQSYFSVFDAIASQLGELDDHLVVDIVAFYQDAKSLVDSFARDAQPDNKLVTAPVAAQRYEDLAGALDRLCLFADRLVARLASAQVGDQIKIAARELRPEISSLIVKLDD
jgi:hypothetical protein